MLLAGLLITLRVPLLNRHYDPLVGGEVLDGLSLSLSRRVVIHSLTLEPYVQCMSSFSRVTHSLTVLV